MDQEYLVSVMDQATPTEEQLPTSIVDEPTPNDVCLPQTGDEQQSTNVENKNKDAVEVAENIPEPTDILNLQAVESPSPSPSTLDQTSNQVATPQPEPSTLSHDLSSTSTPPNASSIGATPEKSLNDHPVRRETNEKKKDDDKLSIYKALAIKLKKELVKSREELQRLKEDTSEEKSLLESKVNQLEHELETIRQLDADKITTLEIKNKAYKEKLENSELDLKNLQNDFENYKIQASRIMQQNVPVQSSVCKTFEEERYKQLKELNEDQKRRMTQLEAQLANSLLRNQELEREANQFREQLQLVQEKVNSLKLLDNQCETLARENENLKLALKQFRSRLKHSHVETKLSQNCDESLPNSSYSKVEALPADSDHPDSNEKSLGERNIKLQETSIESKIRSDKPEAGDLSQHRDDRTGVNTATQLSPSTSLKEDSQTNSSSSFDGSTSGYVHIKPTPFEIISRSSVLEDAQNQIDNLTKAYLDSENTNSLLSEQVKALKEEIRRMQRGTERLDLAENLEYLKNVVFKFLSLESGQLEQKQRLVPVLSTVLKLSPDETAKLNSLAAAEKPRTATSFFKL